MKAEFHLGLHSLQRQSSDTQNTHTTQLNTNKEKKVTLKENSAQLQGQAPYKKISNTSCKLMI